MFCSSICLAKDMPKNVFSAVSESKDHSIIAQISDAGRLAKVEKGSDVSIFAPSDKAFAKLSKKFLDGKLNQEELLLRQNILKHHVIVTSLKLQILRDGKKLILADGESVTLNLKAGKYSVNQIPVTEVIQTKKGLVFVINSILLPAGVKESQITN